MKDQNRNHGAEAEKKEKEGVVSGEGDLIEFFSGEPEEIPEENSKAARKTHQPEEKVKESSEEAEAASKEVEVPGEDKSREEAEERVREQEEEISSLKNRLRKKEAEIKALRKERDEWKDKYLRSLAEMDNARKRLERERDEFTRFALTEFLKELLLVVDNFERALETRDEADGRSFQEGVEMIYRQLVELLRKQGVVPLETKEKKFDPKVHQAVLTEEAEDIEEPEVAEFLLKGYWLHERLLRPALVKVLVPKKRP